MNYRRFWELVADICDFGSFIVAAGKTGASANIVGEFQVGLDGGTQVITKKECGDHIHLDASQIEYLSFTLLNAGYGAEPCLEFMNKDQEICVRMYFIGKDAAGKYQNFTRKFEQYRKLFRGHW